MSKKAKNPASKGAPRQPRSVGGRDSGGDAPPASGLLASPPASLPWSVPLAVDTIPDDGLHRDLHATPEACAAIAALAEVRFVRDLTATLDLALRLSEDGSHELVHVTGRVRAVVGQTCVVTLEPIENEVDEPVEIDFAESASDDTAAGDRDLHRQAADDDAPEPLIGGTIDLGAIATEFLILGIDPYPRKAGVEFAPPAVEDDTPHPFAALAALKDRSGGDRT
ncbi:MAG: DUF177 domain-containing protein [Rhodopseudomonas sp.]|nr:DUF177 domain-containing protein [Rhodopseudomonas sp.]